jgi:hypothetical protein
MDIMFILFIVPMALTTGMALLLRRRFPHWPIPRRSTVAALVIRAWERQ